MTLLEIVQLRDKLRDELSTVEKFLEIARARGASNGVPPPPPMRNGAPHIEPNQRKLPIDGADAPYGNVSEIIRQGIALCGNTYTINDVEKALTQLGKPLTKLQISSTLTRFANKTKEILVEKKGLGNKPTIYKKHDMSEYK
jgi:hypothetical protein